jgi:hypothetical protein
MSKRRGPSADRLVSVMEVGFARYMSYRAIGARENVLDDAPIRREVAIAPDPAIGDDNVTGPARQRFAEAGAASAGKIAKRVSGEEIRRRRR